MKRIVTALASAVLMGAMVAGCAPASPGDSVVEEDALLIFHNATGPMCLEALAWLDTMQSEYPDLVVAEHLTTDVPGLTLFRELKTQYGQSQGVSTAFGYLPVIFFRGQAFSGFNDQVQQSLTQLIASMPAPS